MSERNVAIQKKGNRKPDGSDLFQEYDGEEQKKYIEDTAYKQNYQQIEETYESGTIKITPELARQAINAVQTRIDATEEYTKKRIEEINDNYLAYEQLDNTTDAVDDSVNPVVFNAAEDWIDDLYLIFSSLPESIELEAFGEALDEFVTKTLKVTETDEKNKVLATLRSLAERVFGKTNTKESDVYFFQKKEAIRELLLSGLKTSGYMKELEKFLMMGVISGEFCMKEGWRVDKKYILQMHEDKDGTEEGKQYEGVGKIKRVLEPEEKYTLKAIDTRQLIFRKDSRDWIIEWTDTLFSELLAVTLDENGEPSHNAMYDMNMLNKIKTIMKAQDGAMSKEDIEKLIALDVDGDSQVDMEDIFSIDGDVRHFEANNIPMVIDGKSVKCIVELLRVNDTLIPIRILQTRLIRVPYMMENFLVKIGDQAGKGLPKVIKKLKEVLNDFQNFSIDMINFSIKGIFFGEIDRFEDPSQLNNMDAGDFIQMKGMKGRSIKDVLSWYQPPVEVLGQMFNLQQVITDILNKTTRKGPAGEKIQPNPSATEFNSIMIELQKSVNRVGIRLNEMFEGMLLSMYTYIVMNRKTHIRLKLQGVKTLIENGDNIDKPIVKEIMLTPQELFIEGLEIKSNAIDTSGDKQAVERQQAMQALDLIFNKVGTTEQVQEIDPQTGQQITKNEPRTYIDSSGTEVVIDEYKVIKKVLATMGYEDVFKRKKEQEQQEEEDNVVTGNSPVSVATNNRSSVPNLQASPDAGDIAGGVAQI